MPSPAAVIGGQAFIYAADDDQKIALGYTHIRVYWATSETATATLATSLELVAGQKDYEYNKTDALSTDWFEYAFYGVGPGEGPRSERVPIGPPQTTGRLIRQGAGRRLRIMDGPYTISSVTDADTMVISDLIDPDATPHGFANRFVRVIDGAAAGQTRRTRAAGSTPAGYVPASGTLNVNRATNPAWLAGDVVELWRGQGDDDPSVLMDEAMNRVAYRVWWEETHYFTIDSQVSEYVLPAILRENAISAVEYASDTFPTRPAWRPVPWWYVVIDGGVPVMSLRRHGLGEELFGQGKVIRVRYARHGDAMDGDGDYWGVPLEWAVAETALEYLELIAAPRGGTENVIDAERAKEVLRREADTFRAIYLPQPRVFTRPAR